MSVLIFFPLATTLKEEGEALEREGIPLTADLSAVNGAGFRLTEAITEDAISAFFLPLLAAFTSASHY